MFRDYFVLFSLFFFKQKTAYEMRISDWSSDVCSSDPRPFSRPAISEGRMTLPERQLANAIRALAMDAVQAANSGHPGMPMGMTDVATVLYSDYLKFDPADPAWPDRDRFVLSAGPGAPPKGRAACRERVGQYV